MANEKKPSALAQYGTVGAPLIGAVLAIAFIAVAVMTNAVGEQQTKLQGSIEKVRKKLDSTDVQPLGEGIPVPDIVAKATVPGEANTWAEPESAGKLLQLPILFQITMDSAEADEFDKHDDGPKDGFWNEDEFARTPYAAEPAPLGDFNAWDRIPNNTKDGLISREEYNNKPIGEEDLFAKKDRNSDGSLTTGEDDIKPEEVEAWDDYPYDGKISLEEFLGRFGEKTARDLGPVGNVQAKVDQSKMQIIVSWDDPAVDSLPEDIAFYIVRRAPETVEKRIKEQGKRAMERAKKVEAWDRRFEKWWTSPSAADPKKTNKQLERSRGRAQEKYEAETGDLFPPELEAVKEWELVTKDGPVTGNEYLDTSFETDVTYTYAVRMATKSNPTKGINVGEKNASGFYTWTEDTVAAGHPVIVTNRIAIGSGGVAGDTATLTLTKWHPIANAEGVKEWFKVQISERIDPGDKLGGEYKLAALKDRSVKAFDVNDSDVNALEMLPADTVINFNSGFSYVTRTSKGTLLGSQKLGDFELPKATRGPITVPDQPASTDDSLEVRCLTVKNSAKDAKFELTRWHKIGEDWFRVVLTQSVKKGKDVGRSVSLDSKSDDVVIWDAAGKKVSSGDARFEGQTADLSAGSYDGLDERTITVGGDQMDLFGTLFKG